MTKSLVSISVLAAAVPLCLAIVPACSSNTVNVNNPPADGGTGDTGTGTDSSSSSSGGTQCTQARNDLLLPIDKTSTGQVVTVSEANGVKTVFVDATAGGFTNSVKNPRIYVDLTKVARVDVTDKTAPDSTDWDLSLKRVVLFTNSGDAGSGKGGAAVINKAFANVSAADATAATIAAESFFDESCVAKKDRTDAVLTTFSDWYDYDDTTRIPTPKANVTYIVRGAKGSLFKVGIKAYDAKSDGTTTNNTVTGGYLLLVQAL